jgi:cephalosporin-C deacetylase
MFTDQPLEKLRQYTGSGTEPDDFDEFWATTLAESRAKQAPPRLAQQPSPFRHINLYDVTFNGFDGQPVKAWLKLPHDASADAPVPAIVKFHGYGGGRGHLFHDLFWVESGYAMISVDNRGQGSSWSTGQTADLAAAGPEIPGVMTRGISSPKTYYYRRLMTDGVMALDAVCGLSVIDQARIGVTGGSQGGGMALAVSALHPKVAAVEARVPFLCDFRHATEVTDQDPFHEITRYLAVHRYQSEHVFMTLSYFDGVNFARRGQVPLRMTVALADSIVPPSTVFAAYNNYAGAEKFLKVWEFNGHEGGEDDDDAEAVHFFARQLGGNDF